MDDGSAAAGPSSFRARRPDWAIPILVASSSRWAWVDLGSLALRGRRSCGSQVIDRRDYAGGGAGCSQATNARSHASEPGLRATRRPIEAHGGTDDPRRPRNDPLLAPAGRPRAKALPLDSGRSPRGRLLLPEVAGELQAVCRSTGAKRSPIPSSHNRPRPAALGPLRQVLRGSGRSRLTRLVPAVG